MRKPLKTKTGQKFLTGEECRLFRTSRGLTMAELGRYLGITYQGIQTMEESGCSYDRALALSAVDRGLKAWKPTPEDHETPVVEEDSNA